MLPDMGKRMQIAELDEPSAPSNTIVRPKISLADWVKLQNYIVGIAPEKLPETPRAKQYDLTLFTPKEISLDHENGALLTYLDYDEQTNELYFGDISGTLSSYDFDTKRIYQAYQGETPITWYNRMPEFEFFTEVGILDPSELSHGKIFVEKEKKRNALSASFHRPVHSLVEDLNGDGTLEMVVSEFGKRNGKAIAYGTARFFGF